MPQRSRLKRSLLNVSLIAPAALSVSFPAMSNELMGYKGDRLKGSISCIHPNIIHDLIERIGEAENYTFVLESIFNRDTVWRQISRQSLQSRWLTKRSGLGMDMKPKFGKQF